MNGIVNGLLAVFMGIMAGLASAVAAIELYSATPVEPESPWLIWDVSSGSKVRPYALDHYLMAGRFPPAAGQMREFAAQKASDGSPLDGSCSYLLTAEAAPTLWWTVAVLSSGSSGPTPRGVITADTAVAENDGSLQIAVSQIPLSGNWIRPPSTKDFTLLYTIAEPSSILPRGLLPMFTIERSAC